MRKRKFKKPPCQACVSLKIDCCKDGVGVLWTLDEILRAIDYVEKRGWDIPIQIYRRDIAGVVCIMGKEQLDTYENVAVPNPFADDVACAYQDRKTGLCRIYPVRPYVCKTYGGKKMPCMFNGMTPKELKRRNKENRESLVELHKKKATMTMQPPQRLIDYILAFENDPERMKLWLGLHQIEVNYSK